MKFDALYDKIEKVVPKDGSKNEFGFLAYLVEEVGEVSRCILENNGLKKRNQTESVLSECSDVLNSLLGLYIKLGGTKELLVKNAMKKSIRWEKRVNSKERVK